MRPALGDLPFIPPAGIVTLTIDPTTGQLATDACPTRVAEVFPEWRAPTETCYQHRPGYGQYAMYGPNGYAIDPATGQPIYPYDVDENDDGRLEISNFGYGYGQESAGAEADALPYGPIRSPTTWNRSRSPWRERTWKTAKPRSRRRAAS